LVYVGFDVFHVLKADGEADVVLGDAGGGLLFGGELLVGGRGGVNDQRFGVADVGDVRQELGGGCQGSPCLCAFRGLQKRFFVRKWYQS